MNPDGRYILRREKGDNHFSRLQESSVAMLQRLCGEVWTDYNAHDPGVTMLDILNHALDELRYKLSFPLQDYLVDPRTGSIPFERMGLLPFDELLRGSVVTARDYERLFVENVSEIEACRAVFLHGCYDFLLYRAGVDGQTAQKAARLYHANRNLCETLGRISLGETPPQDVVHEDDGVLQRTPKSYDAVHRDIAAYRSVQLDFPDCYGINRHGTPPHASEQDRARILQLRGYLLIFDILLASAGEQAAHIALGEVVPQRWPEIKIADAQRLIEKKNRNPLPLDFAHKQRDAWLATLDMLYGESTEDLTDNAQKRAETIRRLPEKNRRRFIAADMTDLGDDTEGFHLLEHLLLYPSHEAPEREISRASVFFPLVGGSPEIATDRLPAHIAVELCGLSSHRWTWFERLWFDRRIALAEGDTERIKMTNKNMKNFME